jgi:hypothetical protein
MHWFFDKLGMTGSRAQLYNGLVLIGMFFSCRLVWGTWQSFLIYRDLWAGVTRGPDYTAILGAGKSPSGDFVVSPTSPPARYAETMRFVTPDTVLPIWLAAVYVGSNLTLNSLNFYWFFKMIDAVRKRFEPVADGKGKKEGKESEKLLKGSADGTAVLATGKANEDITTRPRRRTLLDGEDPDAPPPI